MQQHLKRLSIIGSVVVFVAIVILLYGHFTPASQDKLEKVRPVPAVKVARGSLSEYLTLSAELKPFLQVSLYAKVSGYIKQLNVDIGDHVTSGQVIAVLDVPELEADMAKNKAIYDQTALDYSRIKKVIKKHPGLLAQEEVDKAQEAYEVAKANYEHSKTLQNYTVITAPFDGIVTQRFIDEGTLIQTGTNSSTQAKPIVEVAETKTLRLMFPVPESAALSVKAGDPAEVTISATGKVIKSTITRASGKVNEATRTMETEVDLDNTDGQMKPGMYATVKLSIREKQDVIVLPVQAVDIGDKPTVWVINKQVKLEKQSVTLGLKTPDQVEVTQGIAENDLVVIGNRSTLVEGMKVIPNMTESTPAYSKKES